MPSHPSLLAQLILAEETHTRGSFSSTPDAYATFLDIALPPSWESAESLWLGPRKPVPSRVTCSCSVNHCTVTVRLGMSGNHLETLNFHLINTPTLPVILGYPWLRLQGPHLDWSSVPFCNGEVIALLSDSSLCYLSTAVTLPSLSSQISWGFPPSTSTCSSPLRLRHWPPPWLISTKRLALLRFGFGKWRLLGPAQFLSTSVPWC